MATLRKQTHLTVVTDEAPRQPALSDRQRIKRDALVTVMRHLRGLRAGADSLGPAIDEFSRRHAAGSLPASVYTALDTLQAASRRGRCPNRSTLFRWDERYRQHLNGHAVAAAPRHRGRPRREYGWEARAIALYSRPSKPAMAVVADWLREEGFESATDSRVRRFLKSLPADVTQRARLGARLYGNTQKNYSRRDTSCLPVGFIYQGDGHCADVYVAHPRTGDLWRPELTVWIDVASRYVVGWYISEAESSQSTLFALSHALRGWNHVPAMLHIDNGSGFKSKMMNDQSVGFYERFSISTTFSIPGNPKGKGQVERWFRTLEERFGKRFNTYCGGDMADEVKRELVIRAKRGRLKLPSLEEYMTGLARFIERYNNTVHSALDGKTPAELWAGLERTPLHIPAEAVVLPRVARKARRCAVHFANREYYAAELEQYNGETVTVEYDLHDDAIVRILDTQGLWICDATLVRKQAYLPASHIEEAQQKRLAGQRKRLQAKLDEVEARAGLGITHDQVIDDLEALNTGEAIEHEAGPELALEENSGPDVTAPDPEAPSIELDIYDTNYE